ncbi:MAG TPA: hypothetical protein VJJ24_01590 [Candidatus Paceibacterota bacterium]
MKKQKRRSVKKLGSLQKKVLLLLLGGVLLGMQRNSRSYFKVIKGVKEAWKDIDKRSLDNAIKELYESKLVSAKENKGGTTTLILSEKGRQKAITLDISNLQIKEPIKWDGNWRVVLFDIPEYLRKVRDTLRNHLLDMGFVEYQKSVFVHPYPCQNEIDFLIETYEIRRFVRFMVSSSFDDELKFRRHFKLSVK